MKYMIMAFTMKSFDQRYLQRRSLSSVRAAVTVNIQDSWFGDICIPVPVDDTSAHQAETLTLFRCEDRV